MRVCFLDRLSPDPTTWIRTRLFAGDFRVGAVDVGRGLPTLGRGRSTIEIPPPAKPKALVDSSFVQSWPRTENPSEPRLSLWKRIRAGEEEALAEVRALAQAASHRWPLAADVRDGVCQDVMTKVWEEAAEGTKPEPTNFAGYVWNKTRGAVKAWLYGRALRAESAGGRDPSTEPVSPSGASGESAASSASTRELRSALKACHESMPSEKVRRAWELRYETVPTRTAQEVADILGVPSGTVMSWWDRARRHMRLCLERKGWAS